LRQAEERRLRDRAELSHPGRDGQASVIAAPAGPPKEFG
jgi:hypothetical protein